MAGQIQRVDTRAVLIVLAPVEAHREGLRLALPLEHVPVNTRLPRIIVAQLVVRSRAVCGESVRIAEHGQKAIDRIWCNPGPDGGQRIIPGKGKPVVYIPLGTEGDVVEQSVAYDWPTDRATQIVTCEWIGRYRRAELQRIIVHLIRERARRTVIAPRRGHGNLTA